MKKSPTKRKKIALFGHFDSTNFGNESTLRSILYHLRCFQPDAEVTIICTGPDTAAATYHVEAIPFAETFFKSWVPGNPLTKVIRKIFIGLPSELYRWFRGISRLRRTDMLIIPGTGLLTDAYGLFSWGPYNLLKWSLMAKLCRCKLLFVSVGAGPIDGQLGRYFVKSTLALADFRSYRDSSTMQCLERIGFPADRDPIYPDLVFSLPEALIPHPNSERTARPIVGLGVMEYAGRYSVSGPEDATYANYLESLVVFAKWLRARGYGIRLLSGDTGDSHAWGEFRDLLGEPPSTFDEKPVIDEPIRSVEDLLDQIAVTDFVVATRFHNVVLALLSGKPVISISFHHKCESLMSAMGLSVYCLDIRDVSADQLIQKFCALEANARKLKPMIGEKIGEFRKALDEQYLSIFQPG